MDILTPPSGSLTLRPYSQNPQPGEGTSSMGRIGRVFLAGLLAALPLLLTIFIIVWLLSFMNQYLGPSSAFGRFLTSLGFGVGTSELAPYLIGLSLIAAAIYALGLVVHSRLGAWVEGSSKASSAAFRWSRTSMTSRAGSSRSSIPRTATASRA